MNEESKIVILILVVLTLMVYIGFLLNIRMHPYRPTLTDYLTEQKKEYDDSVKTRDAAMTEAEKFCGKGNAEIVGAWMYGDAVCKDYSKVK